MHTKTHQMMGRTFLNCTFIKTYPQVFRWNYWNRIQVVSKSGTIMTLENHIHSDIIKDQEKSKPYRTIKTGKRHQAISIISIISLENLGVCRPRITDEDMALAIAWLGLFCRVAFSDAEMVCQLFLRPHPYMPNSDVFLTWKCDFFRMRGEIFLRGFLVTIK